MTATLTLAPPPPSAQPPQALTRPEPPDRWPRRWSQRRALLERQHERIEGLLDRLIHRDSLAGPPDAPDPLSVRLVRCLTLHLRLEERWLQQAGVLCPGHRVAHAQAAALARQGLERAITQPSTRLAWLIALRRWFEQHRDGPDAIAYSRALQRNGSSTLATAPR